MISEFLTSLFAFLVAIAILVAVHEFGHFWVARKLGVKVLRFSLGFGKVIWRRQRGETEYVLSALPLGGYVKMLGERDTEVPEHERHRAFSTQPVWKRSAIVAAGPLFNLGFAAFVYICVFLVGVPGTRPVVGEIEAGSYAAAAGFENGDLIVTIGGEPVESWEDARLVLLKQVLSGSVSEVSVVASDGRQATRRLAFGDNELLKDEGDILENIGMAPWRPAANLIVMEPQPGSPAERSGLQPGDHISMVDGQPVRFWSDWVRLVQAHPGAQLKLSVQRKGAPIELTIVTETRQDGEKAVGSIGAMVQLEPIDSAAWDRMQLVVSYPPLQSVIKGLDKTLDMTLFSFKIIGKLVVGDASLKNVSGPLTIADYAGKTLSIDYRIFLNLLAVVSIGLAVLNILPIPMLDGGHLLYYAIEFLIGRPLPERIQILGQNIGIFLLACLMSLAFYNDIMRLMR
ncbi:MAG TPA: RIP metalloprotease RseP [Gammaproteobacteria bacterium]|nr:RIP metalloprotease RseP [Gammaproteobacteria bacterium]